MLKVYQHHHVVSDHEIDWVGHANNVAYVAWMQAAGIAHSAANGWPVERYLEMGCGWVARVHRIEYVRPAFRGEPIVVETWIAELKRATCLRRYEVHRPDDANLLARAETRWAFVDFASGQPRRIPAEFFDWFQAVER